MTSFCRSIYLIFVGLLALAVVPASAQAGATFVMIYSFRGPGLNDGGALAAGVVLDPAGNLYGTTTVGGSQDCGTVYKVDAAGDETILYDFPQCGGITGGPDGRLIRDNAGNLYGTAYAAGGLGFGSVFVIDAAGAFTSIYEFHAIPDGRYPSSRSGSDRSKFYKGLIGVISYPPHGLG